MNAKSYTQFVPGADGRLDLIFSHAWVEPGRVAFENTSKISPNAKLYVNTQKNDFYQNGIPGLGDSVEEAARALSVIL